MKNTTSKSMTNGNVLNITFELLTLSQVYRAKYINEANKLDNPVPELQADVHFYSNKLVYVISDVFPKLFYIDTKPTPNKANKVLSLETATITNPIIEKITEIITNILICIKC